MNEESSSARIALKWGLITGLALSAYSAVLYSVGSLSPLLGSITYVLHVVGLVLAMREYRSANGGYMSFGDGVGLGALLSAIAGMLSSAFSVLYTTVIDPAFQERLLEQTREKLEEQGVSDEQIDRMMEMSQQYQSPGLQFVFGIFWLVFVGVILSLIVAAFIRRNKANPFD